MKRKYKAYLKINVVSLFFVALSFISITLAWFAYSGMAQMKTEVNVKSWYIKFEKNGDTVSNNLVISFDNIYPGMETAYEEILIKNDGDSIANLDYSIISASLLDLKDYYNDDFNSTGFIEDELSHKYPFHIDISLSKNYILTNGEAKFKVAISWPLDSDNDEDDSYWGTESYRFQKEEATKLSEENTYQPKSSIKVAISLKAEQYLDNDNSLDTKYAIGNVIYYDVVNDMVCEKPSEYCIKTHVITQNSKKINKTVDLLPDLTDNYLKGVFENYSSFLNSYKDGTFDTTYNSNIRTLKVKDLLNIISNDISNSFLSRDNLSDSIIGNLNYTGSYERELEKVKQKNGYYKFANTSYMYLATNKCYWIDDEYDALNGFALTKIDEDNSKIFGLDKISECSYIPVIIANK